MLKVLNKFDKSGSHDEFLFIDTDNPHTISARTRSDLG
jgi:hypothetical protein